MLREYVFVSCDIVAHSAEADLEKQRANIAAINAIVGEKLQAAPGREIVWASGGDGGHVAFPSDSPLRLAVELILALCEWSKQSSTNLRITANHGAAESIRGADGRIQLVGHGINLAGRLLPFGDQSRIVVTDGFVKMVTGHLPAGVSFHDGG